MEKHEIISTILYEYHHDGIVNVPYKGVTSPSRHQICI